MKNKIKDITSDAILLALLIVLVLLFRYVIQILDTMIPLFISLVLGIRYHKFGIIRQITVSISLLAVSFIFMDIFSILIFIVSGIILGIVAHYTLRIILNLPYYFSTIIVYFVVDSVIEIGYARFLLGLDFNSYLESGMNFSEQLVSNITSTGLIIIFLGYNLLVAILEAILLRIGVFLYEKTLTRLKNKRVEED